MAELAQPGLEPDTPVCARGRRDRARGGAARRSRPRGGSSRGRASATRSAGRPATTPGRAGSAATATSTTPPRPRRRCTKAASGGWRSSTSTCTTPTAPRRWSERMSDTTLHSLHGSTGANLPWRRVRARTRARAASSTFRHAARGPRPTSRRSRASTRSSPRSADAIVLSLGYDTVAGDPHGSWGFDAPIFERIGRLLAGHGAAGVRRPGGRLRARIARALQPRVRPASARRPAERAEQSAVPDERRWAVPSAAAWTGSTSRSRGCSASALRSAARSRSTSARTRSR